MFRQADTEETGHVDTSLIGDLASSVLGPQIKDSERSLIRYHVDVKIGTYQDIYVLYAIFNYLCI